MILFWSQDFYLDLHTHPNGHNFIFSCECPCSLESIKIYISPISKYRNSELRIYKTSKKIPQTIIEKIKRDCEHENTLDMTTEHCQYQPV